MLWKLLTHCSHAQRTIVLEASDPLFSEPLFWKLLTHVQGQCTRHLCTPCAGWKVCNCWQEVPSCRVFTHNLKDRTPTVSRYTIAIASACWLLTHVGCSNNPPHVGVVTVTQGGDGLAVQFHWPPMSVLNGLLHGGSEAADFSTHTLF